ncbi:hypothetical protein [Amycolatopsis sp. FDAARGOS 1241]|uniref:hypothetical protein n=1 Tax=Amycolatopsis sp. FDAARGOS 1241 TaxID=2778070 RepID=UPI00194DF2B8|nr:hypothetical protein [Amycolatopsis sp. FDAARGOS 1241]QRP46706.1 hypothetical protein I6J71_01125 [Amycolatopsis sp. FDAARGOS 1241]
MVDEREKTAEQGEKKSPRTVQVLATALAAVTAALLGSTLGVTGTVVGAGVASVITTVGGELYLRSLQRGREAALKARDVIVTAGQRRASRPGLRPVDDPAQMPTVLLPLDPSEMPTVRLSKLSPTAQAKTQPEEPESFADKLRKLRWPIIIGTSVLATAIAIAVSLGLDATTGGAVGPGVFSARNNPATTQQQTHDDNPPATSENSPPPSTGVSQTPPPTTSSSSTSTTETPTSGSSGSSVSETPPPSSTGGATSTTQSQPRTKAGSATPTP